MTRILVLLVIITLTNTTYAQTFLDSTINSSTKRILFADPNRLSIGSYGEAHYNAPVVENKFSNGTVDLHRVILFMGYKFNQNLQFFTEIEFEHIKEVYVEQAYIDYSVNSAFNVKAGVILIPMGYVNEFHEPTLFNGVERSSVDKYIIPSTWSEVGFGFHGLLRKANLKYQIYAVNGFNGYDGSEAKISGANGLRSSRQKGAEASMRFPSVTGKLTFFGLNGLRMGLSGYYGMTETKKYDGLDRTNEEAILSADSTRLEVGMIALNATYNIGGFQFMAVGNYTSLGNNGEYNEYMTDHHGSNPDVAKEVFGYYGEIAYRWKLKKATEYPQLIPFVRYENYDTQHTVGREMTDNANYHKEVLTGGLGFQITPGTIVKADYQWIKSEANPKPTGLFNLGFGYWF